MGLIHSRASKKRDRAAAKLLDEQRREMKHDHRAAGAAARTERQQDRDEAGRPWYRQPTLGLAIAAFRAGRHGNQEAGGGPRDEELSRPGPYPVDHAFR